VFGAALQGTKAGRSPFRTGYPGMKRRRNHSGRGVRPDGRSARAEQFAMVKFDMARRAVFRTMSGEALKVLLAPFREVSIHDEGAVNRRSMRRIMASRMKATAFLA
jgi:hypothetical protein